MHPPLSSDYSYVVFRVISTSTISMALRHIPEILSGNAGLSLPLFRHFYQQSMRRSPGAATTHSTRPHSSWHLATTLRFHLRGLREA